MAWTIRILIVVLIIWGLWKILRLLASPQEKKIILPDDMELRKKKKKEWFE